MKEDASFHREGENFVVEEPWIVLAGDPNTGFSFFGPYKSHIEASIRAQSMNEMDQHENFTAWSAPLEIPDQYDLVLKHRYEH